MRTVGVTLQWSTALQRHIHERRLELYGRPRRGGKTSGTRPLRAGTNRLTSLNERDLAAGSPESGPEPGRTTGKG